MFDYFMRAENAYLKLNVVSQSMIQSKWSVTIW